VGQPQLKEDCPREFKNPESVGKSIKLQGEDVTARVWYNTREALILFTK